jgi:hypothetical protein
MHENPKRFQGDHLPSLLHPTHLGVATPLSPTITEAPPQLIKDINSLVCGRDIDQHNTSCRRSLKFEKSK